MTKKLKKLQALYDKIPSIECKGLCHQSCTIVPAAKIEIKRARELTGNLSMFSPSKAIKFMKENNGTIPRCPALNEQNRCSIYHARPTMCRAYGVAEDLACAFGCKPKNLISREELFDIIKKIDEL